MKLTNRILKDIVLTARTPFAKTCHAIIAGLTADVVALIAAIAVCRMMLS